MVSAEANNIDQRKYLTFIIQQQSNIESSLQAKLTHYLTKNTE